MWFQLQNPVTESSQSNSEEPSQIQYLSPGGKKDDKRKWRAGGWVVIWFCWGFLMQGSFMHKKPAKQRTAFFLLFPLSKSHGTEMSHFTQTVHASIHNLTLEQWKKSKFAGQHQIFRNANNFIQSFIKGRTHTGFGLLVCLSI